MDADQCYLRASACVANARLAADHTVSTEFLKLAAQWRAMAVRTIMLNRADGPSTASSTTESPAPL